MFYTNFAEDYEAIFPFSEGIYSFLKGWIPGGGRRLLDVGCATGHYCGRFASEGYEVTGIDLDSAMIKSAQAAYPGPEFRDLNLTAVEVLKSSYDFIYSTGNVMAHVSKGDFGAFLDSIARMLPPGRVWIFQVINWDYILTLEEFEFPVIETPGRVFLRRYSDIRGGTLKFQTELRDRNSGESLFKDDVTMYPVSSAGYIELHEQKGFELLGHYGDYAKAPHMGSKFSADIYVFKRMGI